MAIGILLCVAYVSTGSAGTHYARRRMSQEEVGLGSEGTAAERRGASRHLENVCTVGTYLCVRCALSGSSLWIMLVMIMAFV